MSEVQVNFRMPDVLKRRLETAAQESGRTLTAEIAFRLDKGLAGEASVERKLDEILKLLRKEKLDDLPARTTGRQ